MSIIPKIRVSKPSQRSKDNLVFDCSTTANFGDVQPTMCRELVPDESIKVKTSSLVRLASMPTPTFGRLHLRHYHAFVPYEQLYEPFNAFLSQQHYSAANSYNTSFIPTQVWRFNLHAFWMYFILNQSYFSIYFKDGNSYFESGAPIFTDGSTDATYDAEFLKLYLEQVQALNPTFAESLPSNAAAGMFLPLGNTQFSISSERGLVCGDLVYTDSLFALNGTALTVSEDGFVDRNKLSGFRDAPYLVTMESADYVLDVNSHFMICFKLNKLARHLRKIVIGLGYQFTPFHAVGGSDICYENVFKLLAFYKTWFEYFRPQREIGFQDTTCYRFIKFSAEVAPQDLKFEDLSGDYHTVADRLLYFIIDLAKQTYYYLPSDYFSMAIQVPNMGNSDLNTQIGTPVDDSTSYVVASSLEDGGGVYTSSPNYPLIQKLALRLLSFTNKNTVIGSNIREYLKVHFGIVEEDTPDTGGVVKLGISDVNIQISDVMQTAPSEDGYLGEYGGKGIGYKQSDTFDYHAKKFGCWITLSVIIPQSGYYQGTMRENTHKERFDFFTPEFDALGYQVLERRELMEAYECKSSVFNPNVNYRPKEAWGFVPRYSEYKVGRNIVNGDLSLRGMPSMAPYTFDRKFPTDNIYRDSDGVPYVYAPSFRPYAVFDNFRLVGESDDFGQYNRIFNVTSNIVDHFIIHSIFDVEAIAPWKSLSDSFDTFVEGEDVTSVSHS